MKERLFVGLTLLVCALGLTAYYLLPQWWKAAPPPPTLTDAEAKALYGPQTPRGRELIDRANEALVTIQGKCSELHLKYVGLSRLLPESVEFSSFSFWREGQIRTVVNLTTDDVQFEIIANNGMLIGYTNHLLEKSLQNAPYFEPPDQPKLSAPEVMALAVNFLNVCPHDSDVCLAPPKAKFKHEGGTPTKTGMKTQQGEWWVKWQRTDGEGHLFASDFATAVIAEGNGPLFLSAKLDTIYHKDTAPIISQDAAEKAARHTVAQMSWGNGYFAVVHLEESTLEICQPERDIHNYQAGLEDYGRLAWSQTFGCQLPGEPGGWISVYVNTDAQLGKVIDVETGSGIGQREK